MTIHKFSLLNESVEPGPSVEIRAIRKTLIGTISIWAVMRKVYDYCDQCGTVWPKASLNYNGDAISFCPLCQGCHNE